MTRPNPNWIFPALILSLLPASCSRSPARRAEELPQVSLALSGMLQGRLDPCGCASNQMGGLAVRRFLGRVRLGQVVGGVVQDEESRWIVPLPHPSGASLWLNRAENRELVTQALAHIGRLRRELAIDS